MGIGVVGIQTSQKKEQSGPPFVAGSAINGLSVEGGFIVLGQLPGTVGDPAGLIQSREIPCTGRFVTMRDSATEYTEYAAGHIELATAGNLTRVDSQNVIMSTNGAGGFEAVSSMTNGVESFDIRTVRARQVVQMSANGGLAAAILDPATRNWQIGQSSGFIANGTGASLDVVGSFTAEMLVDGSQAGAVALDENGDKGKLFTNEAGAATFTLPPFQVGLHYLFCVQQAVNLVVTADAGDTLNLGGVVSVAGGTATSAAVGSFLHIYCIAANQWVAGTFTGAWVVA